MLQSFTGKRGAAGRGAEQEAARAGIRRGPDQIADALKAEAGIENIERQHRHAVRRIGSRSRDPGRNCAGFGDAFFEDLAVFGFLVVQQFVLVLRFVELAMRGIDGHLAEQRLHAESACLVGDDRNDVFAEVLVAQQLRKHVHEHHGGGLFAIAAAFQHPRESVQRGHRQRADLGIREGT